MFGFSNSVGAVILILLGIVFAVLGIGGTAKIKLEGLLEGVVLTITGVGGIIMIIVGVLLL